MKGEGENLHDSQLTFPSNKSCTFKINFFTLFNHYNFYVIILKLATLVRDRENNNYDLKRRFLLVKVKEISNNPVNKVLSGETKQMLWEKAMNEFPDDRMMQEYFYLRLMQKHLGQETKDKK